MTRTRTIFTVIATAAALLAGASCSSAQPHAVRAAGADSTQTAASPTSPAPEAMATPEAPAPVTTAATSAPATSARATSAPGSADVSGSATDENFDGVAGVTISFEPIAGACTDCAPGSAVTGDDGSYTVTVRPGSYKISCVATGRTCAIDTESDPVPVSLADLPVGPSTITMAIGGGRSDGGDADNSGGNSDPGGGNATFQGHVYDEAGTPVAGATIEFKSLCDSCDQAFTKSAADGSYAITLAAGVYNAECIDDNCGPRGGDGGPYPVDVPPDHQTLDFLVCSEDNYPACLQQ
jgi:protocatechuate 3,4-dioxygenase beta subunit